MSYPNTPGVKINEVSLLPPSIVQVSTAIPVFLGYTASGPTDDPVRITSLKEYEETFGGGYAYQYTINSSTMVVEEVTDTPVFGTYFLYEAVQLFFANGGGACYILSLGHHSYTAGANFIAKADFLGGLDWIEKLDEPTLISFPEAVNLNSADYGEIAEKALNICGEVKEKFTLIDTVRTTVLSTDQNSLSTYRGDIAPANTDDLSYGASYYPHLLTAANYGIKDDATTLDSTLLSVITTADQRYAQAMEILAGPRKAVLPPSSLMAGVYAKVDRDKGVWKAPANVALQGASKPIAAVSDKLQDKMNVDENTGKSINAIREFAGKGVLVWGARTLAGNNNEWRYISVRRLFITVEESVKKATSQFVFENNDSKTWVKVSSMIRSYLDGLWKDGALMGASAEDAFFVQVGLGTTMTEQDVLKGKMIVRIGLAAVRPAEFITLEFSHFLNQ